MEEKDGIQDIDTMSAEQMESSEDNLEDGVSDAKKTEEEKVEEEKIEEEKIDYKNFSEILKCIPDVLSRGKNVANNITINQIYGDSFSGGAQKFDFGEGNDFDRVSVGGQDRDEGFVSGGGDAKVNLLDTKAVYKYLKENQQSPYGAFLITLSIFADCEFEMVVREAEILYHILNEGRREIVNEKEEREVIKCEPFDVSRQELHENFGVKFYQNYLITFGGKILTAFVGFPAEEYCVNILRCVFLEFISLRNKIANYLTRLICSEKISLYAGSVDAIKKICNINPEFFIYGTLARLLENKTIMSDIAISEVLCTIARNSGVTYSAERYLNVIYREKKDMHYHIITLLMCKNLMYKRQKIAKLIHPVLVEMVSQAYLKTLLKDLNFNLAEDEDFVNNIGIFYNIGSRYAEYYIAIIAELYGMLKKIKRTDLGRDYVCLIFFLFINEDYNESCLKTHKPEKFKDMIFIRLVLRDEETSDKLIFLWAELLRSRVFSSVVKHCLEQYLCDRDQNDLDEMEYKKIEYFFIKLFQTPRAQNTILLLIKNLAAGPRKSNRIAKKIYEKIGGTKI